MNIVFFIFIILGTTFSTHAMDGDADLPNEQESVCCITDPAQARRFLRSLIPSAWIPSALQYWADLINLTGCNQDFCFSQIYGIVTLAPCWCPWLATSLAAEILIAESWE